VAAKPKLAQAWCIVTLVAVFLRTPPSAHAESRLAGVKKMVYASEFGIVITGPSDWYGTVQAQSPTGELAYPGWRPTMRAVYVKYGAEEAGGPAFNPTLMIDFMEAAGGTALDYLTRNLNQNRAEPGVSVLEAPAERTIGGRKWATCRFRTLIAGEKGEVAVIQQWYATVHEPVLLLILGGSSEEEFGRDSPLFEQTVATATFGSNVGDLITQKLAQPEHSHGN